MNILKYIILSEAAKDALYRLPIVRLEIPVNVFFLCCIFIIIICRILGYVI